MSTIEIVQLILNIFCNQFNNSDFIWPISIHLFSFILAQDFYAKYFTEESGLSHPALNILMKLTSAAEELTLKVSHMMIKRKGYSLQLYSLL